MAEIKRLNYFNHQFLVDVDFQDEQKYHREMRHAHNRNVHGWGIAYGLQVTKSLDRQVTVSPGMAIDAQGQEIRLLDPLTYNLPAEVGAGIKAYAIIAYDDVQDEADHYVSGSVDNYKRTTERPRLTVSPALPPGDGSVIFLAMLTMDGSGNIQAVDATGRRSISSRIAPETDLEVRSLTLSIPDAPAAGDVRLTISAANVAQFTGALSVTASLAVSQNLTAGGKLAVGAQPSPTAKVTLGGDMGNTKLALFEGGGGSLYGLGVQTRQFRLHLPDPSARFAFLDAPDGTELFSIGGNGNIGIGKQPTVRLDVAGDMRINDADLRLRGGTDTLHGIGWYGAGKLFATNNIDGPVVYGNSGGALGVTNAGAQSIALSWNANGNVGIGKFGATERLDVAGSIRLNDFDIVFRGGTDDNHGVGWYGGTKLFANANIDGPVLYGWTGGGLGSLNGGQRLALSWSNDGVMQVRANLYVGAYTAGPTAPGRLMATGPGAEIGFARRTLAAWAASPAQGDRFVWYNPDGAARFFSEVAGDVWWVGANGALVNWRDGNQHAPGCRGPRAPAPGAERLRQGSGCSRPRPMPIAPSWGWWTTTSGASGARTWVGSSRSTCCRAHSGPGPARAALSWTSSSTAWARTSSRGTSS